VKTTFYEDIYFPVYVKSLILVHNWLREGGGGEEAIGSAAPGGKDEGLAELAANKYVK
jgi:hypothetical protein